MGGRSQTEIGLLVCVLIATATVAVTGEPRPTDLSNGSVDSVTATTGSTTETTTVTDYTSIIQKTSVQPRTSLEVGNCSRLTPLESRIALEELPELDENLTRSEAVQFAIEHEIAYARAHVLPEDAGLSTPSTTVNRTANGYLVRLSYIYGGTRVITSQPSGPSETTALPETTVIHWDRFPVVYYYVSPTLVLRSDSETLLENPRTDGKVVYCVTEESRHQ